MIIRRGSEDPAAVLDGSIFIRTDADEPPPLPASRRRHRFDHLGAVRLLMTTLISGNARTDEPTAAD